MKILINTSSTFKGGGVQVAKSFIEECNFIKDNSYCVVLSEPLQKSIDQHNFDANFTFINAPFRPATKFFSFKSHNKFLKVIERKFRPDIVFTTSGPSYWRPKAIHLMGYNIPHYIYPESPYFDILNTKTKFWWFCMKRFAYFNFKYNADAYVTQTDDVRDRLKKFINKNQVYTVTNTINSHYLSPQKAANKLPDRTDINELRLLTLSAWYPHKNLNIIAGVIELMRKEQISNVKFIITVDDESYKKSTLYNYKEVINIGRVKIEEAPSLYNECDIMFLPTLLECFSASYVEAMKMKKPILTSDMGFARTVCKDAALYFDPISPKSIFEQILKIKNSKNLYNDLVKKGTERVKVFGTAKQRAERYLEICKFLISENRK